MSKVISKKDNYLQNAMEATSDNIAKSSAAITPQMDSTEDFSLKGNPKVLEAVENVDEAKSLDVRDSSNNATVKAAEDNVQTAVKEAQDEKYKFDSNEELNDTDEESALAKGDIEEAVVAAKESGQEATPQTILTNVADKYGFGLLKFDENGQIIVPTIEEESQWKRSDTSGKLAMVGTVLSCIVSALSGGNIPPINFNKIMGVDKQYTTYLANVHQYNEALSSGVKQEAENVADADYASYMSKISPKERNILENISSDYEYTKSIADQERLKTQGQVSKDLINAQATSAVNYLITLQNAYNEGLITDKTFKLALEKTRADFGQWTGLWERITDRAGIGADIPTKFGNIHAGVGK